MATDGHVPLLLRHSSLRSMFVERTLLGPLRRA